MKKGLIFAALALVMAMFCSCGLTATKATVNVTVKNQLGIPQSGVIVYMYDADEWVAEGLLLPASASKYVVTEDDGVAVFNLNTMDLDIIDNQATVYFVVFDAAGDERGSVAVTVKKGDNKRVDLILRH